MLQKKQSGMTRHLYPALVCFVASLFYVYEFTLRTMPSGMESELMRDFHISAGGLGFLGSMFYYGYTLMQIPAGLLIDRFGTRKLFCISVVLCIFSTALFGQSHHVFIANLSFLLIGFAASTAFVGSLVIISNWFPPKYFAMAVGLVQFLGCIGAIMGVGPIVAFVSRIGWHATVNWLVAIGVLIFILIVVFVRNSPKQCVSHQLNAHKKGGMSELQRLSNVCCNPQNWWVGLYAFAIWTPIVVMAGLWGLPFLMVKYDINAQSASWGITILWLGVAIGGPVAGLMSNLVRSRCEPLIFCAAIAVVTSILVLYVNLSWAWMCVMLFFLGVSASGQALSFGVTQDNNHKQIVGTAIGFNNMAVVVGGMFLLPMIGMSLKHHWTGGMLNGAPVYALHDYRLGLICVPLISLFALVAARFYIKETHCILKYTDESGLSP